MTNNSNNYYFKSEEFINNLRLYEDSQKAGGGCILSSDELADIAEYYFEKGAAQKARSVAEYAISLYPDATSPLVFLARFYINVKRDYKTAYKYISRITDTSALEYYTILIEYYLATGEYDKARQTFIKAEDNIDQEDSLYLILDTAYLLYDYGQTDEADKLKERIEDKESEDYMKMTARSLSERGDNDGAIEMLEKVIDKDPFNVDNWILISSLQLMADKYSDSATSAEYAIAIDDKQADAYMNLGNSFFKMCNYTKALDAYDKYSKLSDNELGDILRARCYFCMQDTAKAYQLLMVAKGKCTDNKNNLIDIYKDLAIVCGWSSKPETAFEYINLLKKEKYKDAELNLIEGSILLGMKKLEEANDVFTIGYELSTNKQEYLFQVAVSFYEHSYDKAAYLLFKEIFTRDPKRIRGLAYLAVTCNYLGFEDEFLKYLTIAVEKNPDEAKAVLGEMFPNSMQPYDYPEYARRTLGKK